jgi:hypothetical protein
MQPTESTSSPIWEALKYVGGIGTFLLAIVAFVGTLLNRKKRSTQNAELDHMAAESALDRADASDKYGRLAFDALDKLASLRRETDHLSRMLDYRTAMETIARNRTHRMTSAYQAAILAVREREELLRRASIECFQFPVRTQEEIFGDEDLPLPPEGVKLKNGTSGEHRL